MTVGYESLVVESAGPGAGLLRPGRIERALALSAGVRAEEIGLIEPVARTRATVEIVLGRAITLATPRPIALYEGGRPALFILRREDDPPAAEPVEILVRTSSGAVPPPGVIARAIGDATAGQIGPEELGLAFAGPDWVRVAVPARLLASVTLPAHLDATLAAGERVSLELSLPAAADDGKKNS